MTKALVLSLLLLAMALAAGEAAPTAPNPAAAKQASDALQTRDEAVKAADAKAAATLKKLMTKYKKDTPTLTMLAVKLHKLDPNDADAIAALKDVPADQADLLGNAAEPGKYMTDVQAKVIADALLKGKFTDANWSALPGVELTVKCSQYLSLGQMEKGRRLLIVPKPGDKWRQVDGSSSQDWRGIGGNSHQGGTFTEMCIRIKVNDKDDPIKMHLNVAPGPQASLPSSGEVQIGSWAANGDRQGSIAVKVYEVVSVGE